MRNNKGFAISLMLYAMILLIVTIFYIVLAIVKNRFTYSEAMVNNVTEFLDKHDASLGHGDRTGPLIVFSPTATAFDKEGSVVVDIFDDTDGKGLQKDSIIIRVDGYKYYPNTQLTGKVVVNQIDDKHAKFTVVLPDANPSNNYHILAVSVMDKENNYAQTLPRMMDKTDTKTYSYQMYGYAKTGPKCTVDGPYKRIMTKVDTEAESNYIVVENGEKKYYHIEYINIKITTDNKDASVQSGANVYYAIDCEGVNGINAYLNKNDFKDNDTLEVANIIVIKGINKVKVILDFEANLPAEQPGCSVKTPELKTGISIKDSINNLSENLFLPSVNVCLINEPGN